MSKKYRVVQISEQRFIIEKYILVDYDPRDNNPLYIWGSVNAPAFMTLQEAKGYIDKLIKETEFPKVVYETK